MKIAVIVAMDKEKNLLNQLADSNLLIATCGIGKVAAALKTAEIINNFRPDLVVNSGVAGGLQNILQIGDTVCGTEISYHDVWCGKPNAYGQVQGFPHIYHSSTKLFPYLDADVKKGLIVSGDYFVSSLEECPNIKKHFPNALAVDMESAAIAQTCHIYKTPFLILRLISDIAGSPHHEKQYIRFWKTAAEKSFARLQNLLSRLTDAEKSVD